MARQAEVDMVDLLHTLENSSTYRSFLSCLNIQPSLLKLLTAGNLTLRFHIQPSDSCPSSIHAAHQALTHPQQHPS